MSSATRLVAALMVLAFPLLEVALLIAAGRRVGIWPVLFVILATGLLGAWVARRQGLAAFRRVSASLAAGEQPHAALADGALLLLAGALLILPGFMTDCIGLVLLVPGIRRMAGARMFKSALVFSDSGRWADDGAATPPGQSDPSRRHPQTSVVIEGEFERLDERTVSPRGAPARRTEAPNGS